MAVIVLFYNLGPWLKAATEKDPDSCWIPSGSVIQINIRLFFLKIFFWYSCDLDMCQSWQIRLSLAGKNKWKSWSLNQTRQEGGPARASGIQGEHLHILSILCGLPSGKRLCLDSFLSAFRAQLLGAGQPTGLPSEASAEFHGEKGKHWPHLP